MTRDKFWLEWTILSKSRLSEIFSKNWFERFFFWKLIWVKYFLKIRPNEVYSKNISLSDFLSEKFFEWNIFEKPRSIERFLEKLVRVKYFLKSSLSEFYFENSFERIDRVFSEIWFEWNVFWSISEVFSEKLICVKYFLKKIYLFEIASGNLVRVNFSSKTRLCFIYAENSPEKFQYHFSEKFSQMTALDFIVPMSMCYLFECLFFLVVKPLTHLVS